MYRKILVVMLFVLYLLSYSSVVSANEDKCNSAGDVKIYKYKDNDLNSLSRGESVDWLNENSIKPDNFSEICLEGFGCRQIRPILAATILSKPEFRTDLFRENKVDKIPEIHEIGPIRPYDPPPPETIPPNQGSICGKPVNVGFWDCEGYIEQSCQFEIPCNDRPYPYCPEVHQGRQRVNLEWNWISWECVAQCETCIVDYSY